MNRTLERNENVLFVEDFVSNRTQDVFLHNPPSGDSTILRDVRRRANAVVKQPHYYNKNHNKSKRNRQYENLRLLPLHKYNAKRMHMKSMWGWYLPVKHYQRSDKSVLKHLSKATIVHDSSYYETFAIQGNIDDIQVLLHEITLDPTPLSQACIHNQIMQTIPAVLKNPNSVVYLGPVDLLCEGTTVYLSCHPSIARAIEDKLTTALPLTLTCSHVTCCRLSLRGCGACDLLPLFGNVAPPSNSHITLTSFTPKPHHRNYHAPEYHTHNTKEHTHQQLRIPKQKYFFDSKEEQIPSLNDEQTPSLSDLFTEGVTCCLVSVQHPNKHKAASGLEVFVSTQTAPALWTALMERRVIPMAQTEWHHYHTFVGLSLFPYDYPDTPVGLSMCLEQYTNPFEKPDKPIDLACSQHSLIQMHSQLQCFSGLLPVARTLNDINDALPLFSQKEGNKNCMIAVDVKVIGKGSISLPCSIRIPSEANLQQQKDGCYVPSISNEIIGFLTSCLYSQKASAYVGIGFCASNQLWNTLRSQKSRSDCIVLLADNRTPSACFARLTVSTQF